MIEGKSVDLGTFITSCKEFQVPRFQRSYSWDTEGDNHVGEWLNDIQKVVNNEQEYFVGTVVGIWNKEQKKLTIVDGQQRMTTTYMILHLMKEIYDSKKDSNPDSIKKMSMNILIPL